MQKNTVLWGALALHFVLGAALLLRVPLGASPDESAHWEYIAFIAQNWNLPVFRGAVPPAAGYEFHQPPLYYALCAPLWALLPVPLENYAARLVSLLCGLGTLVALFRAGKIAFPDSKIAETAVFFAALSPLHLGVGAGSNNDGLAGMICAWLLFWMAHAWKNGVSRRAALCIGILAALGLYAKTTTLVVSFVALTALLFLTRRGENESSTAEKPATRNGFAIAALLLCVLALPLLLRNQFLYGDPLGYAQFSAAAKAASPGIFQFEQVGIPIFNYVRGMAWLIFLTTWGFFGGPTSAVAATRPLGNIVVPQAWMLLPMILCTGATLLAVLGMRRLENLGEAWRGVWKWWLFAALLVFLAWANFAVNHIAGGQARYLHPAFVPLTLAFSAGFLAIWPTKTRKIAIATFAALLLFLWAMNFFVWKTLV